MIATVESIAYRVGQFARAVTARSSAHPPAEIAAVLPPRALALFLRMPANDQRHALAVYAAIASAVVGERRALLQAALLHDVGKADPALKLWHRVAIVLLGASRPALIDRIARPQTGSWRYPFWLHRQHPALGAALAEDAGCDPTAVALIRYHQGALPAEWRGTDKEILWKALKEADDRT